jgi:DNA-binding MarR family transcriptional regulator
MTRATPAATPATAAPAAQAAEAATDLRVLVSRLRRRFRDLYREDDLTASQMAVLGRLYSDGPSSTSDLAAAEHVRPQSMAATLAALDERGMIRRDPDPADGRRQLISLTDAGRDTVHDSRRLRDEWLSRALQERYSDAERTTIVEALALLERLIEP